MPPKRKQREDDIALDSGPEVIVVPRPTTTVPIQVQLLENIERFRAQRDKDRENIASSFNKYVAETKQAIANHYASKAETRALLIRYAKALEQRAAIERSIETLLLKTREDAEDLVLVLEAVQIGNRRRLDDASGSFASLVPKSTASAPTVTPCNTTDKRILDVGGEAWGNTREKEGHARDDTCAKDAKHQNEEWEDNRFDEISW
ncbi:hypothetical protein F5Y12DRAFT_719605 [Xylaria sp. FL1777]|nr:hypothetical protein F5Y12DRAFT_719605 [Xylaria sp. FL1777]